MPDIREEILNKEYREWVDKKGVSSIYPINFPEAYKDSAINAMDENGKRMCLDLLEFMAKNNVVCDNWNEEQLGEAGSSFKVNGQYLTKEQLFENFL